MSNIDTQQTASPEELTAKTVKKVKRAEKSVKEYQYFVLRLVILLAVIWVLFFQIVGLTHMPSGDMYPRVDAGDLVLFYRLDKDVKAQDVVVLSKVTPDSEGKKELFISRVVAVAGDTVEITDDGRLIVNGNSMIESNIFYTTSPYEGYTEYPLTLGQGQCFVLADSRRGGADSRYFGPVNQKDLLGTVITIVRRNNL
ncbi:MAG: signal peptidase I [Oscillospiraceae bacterium]|nr:signal peptidase I [Oscillospiraceae bacterium]